MPSRLEPSVVAAVDAGTSAAKVVVAEVIDGGPLNVIGMGAADAQGMRRGVVVHPAAATSAIRQAIAEAELTAGIRITNVALALSGAHLIGLNTRSIVATCASGAITPEDTRRAIDAAIAPPPPERDILQVVPQEFAVDTHDGVPHPVGMAGTRLEAKLHVIAGSIGAVRNLVACVERAGASVGGFVPGPLACGEAVLSGDEKTLGVAVIDFGGGTTSVGVFDRGVLCHTAVVPEGGDHVTTDLAVAIRTTVAEAERVKRRYSRAVRTAGDEETVRVARLDRASVREVPWRTIADIVETRIQHILDLVRNAIGPQLLESITGGAVLTGGGSELIGLDESVAAILGVPVRRGMPSMAGPVADLVNVTTLSSAAGVAICAARDRRDPPPVRFDERLRRLIARFV